jgi:hypothetical protein
MSTAGKVLTVLILLVTVIWLVMMSAVTQLNVNWQAKIGAQQTDLDRVTLELTKAKDSTLSLTEQARAKQDQTDRELRVRLSMIAAAERRQSSKIEDLTRIKAQVADSLGAAETAKANLATREAEKIKNQEDLAKKRDEIAKAQAVNADLKAQLAQLQQDFKRLLAENVAKLDKAAKQSTAKPASNVRESPSS